MDGTKRDSERIPIPGQVHGEVTVFQPMTILDMSERGALRLGRAAPAIMDGELADEF